MSTPEGFHTNIISDATLWIVPKRWTRRDIVVLKFGGTTVGSTPEAGRIDVATKAIADLMAEGKSVVPVFSAYRRGRSQSKSKISVTDILQRYRERILSAEDFWEGVDEFYQQLRDIHFGMIDDLKLHEDSDVCDQIEEDLQLLRDTAVQCCNAYEDLASLDDYILTSGERLAVRILSAHFNRLHQEGAFLRFGINVPVICESTPFFNCKYMYMYMYKTFLNVESA